MNQYLVKKLSSNEVTDILALSKVCESYDQFSYSPYLGEDGIEDDFFVLTYEEELLTGFLSCFMTETADITGFVHPNFRCRGIFSQMFGVVFDSIEDSGVEEILFAGKKGQPGFCECAKKLKATDTITEYLLQYHKTAIPHSEIYGDYTLLQEEASLEYHFHLNGREIGHCNLWIEPTRINIFDLFVDPPFRGKGYGRKILKTVLFLLEDYDQTILLQVSDKNKPAYGLYTTCGFEIIQSVLFYSRFV